MLTSFQGADLKLLRVFYAVARHGSFAGAQFELNTSAATISTSISQLEQRLGVTLCQRGAKGFALTGQGQMILSAAERLFASVEDFRSDAAAARETTEGEVRIGLIDNIITSDDLCVSAVIRTVSERHPSIRFRIFVGAPSELQNQLFDGRLNIAFGMFDTRPSDFEYTTLFHEVHELYCGAGHEFFRCPDEGLDDAQIAAASYASREYWERFSGLEPPLQLRSAGGSPYIEGLALLVLTGAYLAYLPTHFASQWVARGAMRSVKSTMFRRQVPISNGPWANQTVLDATATSDVYAPHASIRPRRFSKRSPRR